MDVRDVEQVFSEHRVLMGEARAWSHKLRRATDELRQAMCLLAPTPGLPIPLTTEPRRIKRLPCLRCAEIAEIVIKPISLPGDGPLVTSHRCRCGAYLSYEIPSR